MASPHQTQETSRLQGVITSLKSVEQEVLPQPPRLQWVRKRLRAKVVVLQEPKRKIPRRVALVDGEEILESKKEHNSDDSHMDGNEDASDVTNDEDSDGNMDDALVMELWSKMSNAKRVRVMLQIYKRLHLRATQTETTSAENLANQTSGKKASPRHDLKALSLMVNLKALLNYPEKVVGEFPGLDVGHKFASRAEMISIGLHNRWLKFIDYLDKVTEKRRDEIKREWPLAKSPLAVAIVMSGGYEDDVDNLEEPIYTGQRQCRDQRMGKSDLALKNSMEASTPVRVIRGHVNETNKRGGKFYTYDGLYNVTGFWTEKGHSGFIVYKYRLQRLVGQPNLTIFNKVKFVRGGVPETVSNIPLICQDISNGLERIPVPASNTVDKPPQPPTDYTYMTTTFISEDVPIPHRAKGCNCVGSCIDHEKCACAKKNGSTFPYVSNQGVRLVRPMDVVYECGPQCGCGPECINRASQQGLQYNLEVFKTDSKGWACRSWDYIPAGAFICEYIGVLKQNDQRLEHSLDNSYIFELDLVETIQGLDGRKKRSGDAATKLNGFELGRDVPKYVIDGEHFGNVSRFLNHSCNPNVFIQCVLSGHDDFSMPRIAMFAADHILPRQELCYDYGYALNSVVRADGTIKKMPCYCGAAECRQRMF